MASFHPNDNDTIAETVGDAFIRRVTGLENAKGEYGLSAQVRLFNASSGTPISCFYLGESFFEKEKEKKYWNLKTDVMLIRHFESALLDALYEGYFAATYVAWPCTKTPNGL